MKLLHRPDLFAWSRFNEARNIDFHSVLWKRPEGNVVIDPLPLNDHERARLKELGGAAHIVVTNSDHTRAAEVLARATEATISGPVGEQDLFPFECARWLADGDEVVPGLQVFALRGSKTPGELALLLEGTTLITGDLVRAHKAGGLDLLPDSKLGDRSLAVESLRRLAALEGIQAVLPGDGWPVFRDGGRALRELLERVETA